MENGAGRREGVARRGEEQGEPPGGKFEDRRELQQKARERKKSKRSGRKSVSIRKSISIREPTRNEWRRGRKRGGRRETDRERDIDSSSMRVHCEFDGELREKARRWRLGGRKENKARR